MVSLVQVSACHMIGTSEDLSQGVKWSNSHWQWKTWEEGDLLSSSIMGLLAGLMSLETPE